MSIYKLYIALPRHSSSRSIYSLYNKNNNIKKKYTNTSKNFYQSNNPDGASLYIQHGYNINVKLL